MGGRQIEHSYSKVGQSVGSMKSACVCVFVCKRVIQLFLFPCYKMFAFNTSSSSSSSHPESVGGFFFVCVCVYLCY